MFIDFTERGRKREREERNINVREKHWPVASSTPPHRDLNLQPRYVLQPGIKPTTFCCMGQCSNQLGHLARAQIHFWVFFLFQGTFFCSYLAYLFRNRTYIYCWNKILVQFMYQTFAPSIPMIYALLNFNILEKISKENMVSPLCKLPDFFSLDALEVFEILKYYQDVSGNCLINIDAALASSVYIIRFPIAQASLLLLYFCPSLSSFCSGLLFRNLNCLCWITILCSNIPHLSLFWTLFLFSLCP